MLLLAAASGVGRRSGKGRGACEGVCYPPIFRRCHTVLLASEHACLHTGVSDPLMGSKRMCGKFESSNIELLFRIWVPVKTRSKGSAYFVNLR